LKIEVGRPKTEDRRQETEDRRQETEDGRQETEDGRRKTKDRSNVGSRQKKGPTNDFIGPLYISIVIDLLYDIGIT